MAGNVAGGAHPRLLMKLAGWQIAPKPMPTPRPPLRLDPAVVIVPAPAEPAGLVSPAAALPQTALVQVGSLRSRVMQSVMLPLAAAVSVLVTVTPPSPPMPLGSPRICVYGPADAGVMTGCAATPGPVNLTVVMAELVKLPLAEQPWICQVWPG